MRRDGGRDVDGVALLAQAATEVLRELSLVVNEEESQSGLAPFASTARRAIVRRARMAEAPASRLPSPCNCGCERMNSP